MNPSGKSFVVTGGASGLGAATTAALIGAGAKVTIADVNEQAGTKLAETLGGSVQFSATDVTDEHSARQTISNAVEHFGDLHGLINCAGIAIAEKVLGRDGPHPLDTFSRTIQINLVGTFNMARLAAAQMSGNEPLTDTSTGEAISDGERGVIINTASVAAYEGQIGQTAYSASKGGIVGLTLPMARELASHGIRVNAIAPGLFMTPLLAALPEAVQTSLAETIPFPKRLGDPAEFGALVCSIISNSMLNGETIRLDGALRMAPR